MNSKKVAYIVKTKDVYSKILEELVSLESEIFKVTSLTESKFQQLLNEYSSTFNNLIKTYMEDNYLKLFSSDISHLKKNLIHLKKDLESINFITVYLAIDPSQRLIEKLLVKLNSQKNAYILDIKVNQSLLGGLILSVNGKYLDYSLQTKLNSYEF